MHLESGEIDGSLHLWIGGQKHLKAAVEAIAINNVGTNPPSNSIARLDQGNALTSLNKAPRTGQPGDASADDGGVDRVRKLERHLDEGIRGLVQL